MLGKLGAQPADQRDRALTGVGLGPLRPLTLEKAVGRAARERRLGTYVRLRKQLAEDGLENLAAPRCAYAAVPRCRCRECETLRRADRNWSQGEG